MRLLRPLALLAFLLLLALPGLADPLRCAVCGQEIQGRYYEMADGRVLCGADFNRQRPHCSACGRAIDGQYYEVGGGRILCGADYEKQRPRCSACGLGIQGRYYEMGGGRVLCEADYQKQRPHCSACGLLIQGAYYEAGGRVLCPADYDRQLPHCDTCGAKLAGSYVLVGAEKEQKVCSACSASLPGCSICGLKVPRSGQRLSDGRYLCSSHAQQAIMDPREAAAVVRGAEEVVVAALGPGMRLAHPIDEVLLADRTQLAALHQGPGTSPEGLAGMFQRQTRGTELRYRVYLLNGLPRERLLSVAAHEYAHAWQSENNARFLECSDRFKEGFAQWVAWRVNEHLGRRFERLTLLSNPALVYTQGLRAFTDLGRQEGDAATLRRAATQVDF